MGVNLATARSALFICLALCVGLVLYKLYPPDVVRSVLPAQLTYPWLHLQESSSETEQDPVVELVFVGDIMLGRDVSVQADMFRSVAPLLHGADQVIGNFEGVIGDDESYDLHQGNPLSLVTHPDSAQILADAGFDLLSLANNHSFDLGLNGFKQTISQFSRNGIQLIGIKSGSPEVKQPYTLNINGIRLAFVAVNAIPWNNIPGTEVEVVKEHVQGWVKDEISAIIRQADALSDMVIVSIHWGYEYQLRSDPAQELIAGALLEMGADIIIGHHPHVIQPIQIIEVPLSGGDTRTTMVAYSLGNFVFDQGFGETGRGLALRILVDKSGLQAVQALPISAGSHPRMIPVSQSESLLKDLFVGSTHVSYDCTRYPCLPAQPTGDYVSGKFHSDSIDLTGDGIGEEVILNQNRVFVYHDDELVWLSPLEWDVVDLALGDPNDDGRYEMMLAINKPDENGISRSHPFMVGYRGGIYRLLWGGSAVSDPIYEVEIGNIDPDPEQELVVIEGAGDGHQNRIAVWSWHGWGFSKDWESEGSLFRNLVLAEDTPGWGVIISAHRENPGP